MMRTGPDCGETSRSLNSEMDGLCHRNS